MENEIKVEEVVSLDNKLVCKICRREFKSLVSLSCHVKIHKIKIKDYYDKYLKKEGDSFCLRCGKETKFLGLWGGYQKFCSLKCSNNNQVVKEKKKQTSIKNYGVDHPTQSKEIKEKTKNTNLKKYGVEYTQQNKEIKNKSIKTNLKKYGTENVFQSKEIQNRYINTCLKKYGVKNTFQQNEVKEKIKQTNLKKYGVENPSQSKEIREKYKQTMVQKYGVENASQSVKIKEKKKQTSLEKYGKDHWSKTDQGKLISRESAWKRTKDQKFHNERPCPCTGKKERLCLDILELKFNNYIERQPNIDWLFPDGRILHLRLLIEYDEPGHYNHGYSQHDIKRENYLTSQGYIMFRIKQCDWENNREWTLEQLGSLIQNLTEEYFK